MSNDIKFNGIFQKGRKHPLFGTPVITPFAYAWADFLISIVYTPFAIVVLTGTALKVFSTLALCHFAIMLITDYKTYLPLNVPELPMIFMNMCDLTIIVGGIICPLFMDGFVGPIKIIFPMINLILGPCVYIFLDPFPPDQPVDVPVSLTLTSSSEHSLLSSTSSSSLTAVPTTAASASSSPPFTQLTTPLITPTNSTITTTTTTDNSEMTD